MGRFANQADGGHLSKTHKIYMNYTSQFKLATSIKTSSIRIYIVQ